MFDCCHFELRTHSLERARAFYVDLLGLEELQYMPEPGLLAVRAGNVRISIFAGADLADIRAAAGSGGHVVLRTADIDATVAALEERGLTGLEIAEAPNFLRFVRLEDESGNPVEIGQYLRDPLKPA